MEDMSEDEAEDFAAAVANYLFGKEHDQIHIQHFSVETIETFGNYVMQNDAVIRELVVQSLRIQIVISQKTEKILGQPILETYGKEYPEPPNPTTYPILIEETILSMSPTVRNAIKKHGRL